MRSTSRPTLVVAGTGLAGAKVVEEVLKRDPDRFQIRMFGATNSLQWCDNPGIFVHSGVKLDTIRRDDRVVFGGGGKVAEPFDYLVLATGSRPFVPPIEGTDLRGVFVVRTLDDCRMIDAYAENCERAVVLGGGLLGLEAARGLLSHGLDVTVVETAPRLLAHELDTAAAALLQRKLEVTGVRFLLAAKVAQLVGTGGVKEVRCADGTLVEADMVVISCGSRPNVAEAQAAGLAVERGIIVDDQLRSTDEHIHAIGTCAQHRGLVYGLVDPVYEQASVLADVLCETKKDAAYTGSKLATTLKVMGVDLTSLGDVHASGGEYEVVSHVDPGRGTYKKLVLRGRKLIGAILLGIGDPGGKLKRLFLEGTDVGAAPLELLAECGPHEILIAAPEESRSGNNNTVAKNKVEIMKEEKDGLDAFPDVLHLAENNDWAGMTEDDKQRAKWFGLFYRKPTPGNFMLRLRLSGGQTNAEQFRVIADLSDEFGKGFCDLTTRQQLQMRWFTLGDVPTIWRRLEDVGLSSLQTGMDNVRGVCGCPVSGLTPHELFDAGPVAQKFNDMILGRKEFSNLPRKFNVTISGCLENCCHAETQDIALVPAYRELDGAQVNGFNVLVGGKQGSGGLRPASALDVFVRPDDAPALCAEITRIFRDHGSRATRNRARLAFLIDDRGVTWFRGELENRWGRPLYKAGADMRKKHHSDHLGIHPQKKDVENSRTPHYVGFLVPVGRITTAQMRGVADLADRYGTGQIRVTVGQNLVIPNIPEERIGALSEEPLFRELPFDPSPIMRGLVACTGNDYCGLALIETKGYALQVARELEERGAGRKLQPLTIHWSGCPAGCGLHQVATIGLQGCRSRVNGQVVDAAHVCVGGKTGPETRIATDLMCDVPIERLADALDPLVSYLPRQ